MGADWLTDVGTRPGPTVMMPRVVVCGVVAVTVQEITIGPMVSLPGPIKSYGVARMRSMTLRVAVARAVVTSAIVSWRVMKRVVVAIPTTPKARTRTDMTSSMSEEPAVGRVGADSDPGISWAPSVR